MNKYTTIIFDLDGTLLNTLEDLTNAVNYVLNKHNFPIRTIDEIQSFVGNGIRKLIERALPHKINDMEFEIAFNEFQNYYGIHCQDATHPYENVIDLLKILRQKKYNIAIISNKSDDKVQVLKDTFFKNLVDIAVGTKDFAKTKPNPESTLSIISFFKSNKENCLFVGDSDVDILTAQNAGIRCISVSWGFKSKDDLIKSGATTIIDNPLQLLDLLK